MLLGAKPYLLGHATFAQNAFPEATICLCCFLRSQGRSDVVRATRGGAWRTDLTDGRRDGVPVNTRERGVAVVDKKKWLCVTSWPKSVMMAHVAVRLSRDVLEQIDRCLLPVRVVNTCDRLSPTSISCKQMLQRIRGMLPPMRFSYPRHDE